MDFYAFVVKNVSYPLLAWKNRSNVLRNLRECKKTQYLSPEEIRELQFKRLKRIVQHAYKHCPFYRHRFKALSVMPEDLKDIDDVEYLPVLTKSDIQKYSCDLIANDRRVKDLIKDRTGGSTGEPVEFYYDSERQAWRQASRFRFNGWAGWEMGAKVASIWGARRDFTGQSNSRQTLRRLLLRPGLFLDASNLTEERMSHFIVQLKRFQPTIITGYAKSLVLFAKYLIEKGVYDIKPNAVVSTAEVLSESERDLLTETFGCPVFNRYGCREVGPIAMECENHSGMHVNDESLYVEVVKGDKLVGFGECGKLLITDLLNYAMPLIRYEIGDVGMIIRNKCTCGRGLSMIANIKGRITDFISLPDGRVISGPIALPLITNVPGLKQAQIIQHKPDLLELRVVGDSEFDQGSRKMLLKNARRFFGLGIDIKISKVAKIANEKSGKYRFTISKVNSPFLV